VLHLLGPEADELINVFAWAIQSGATMDTSHICVPDTWLKRDLHALASASGVRPFSCVLFSCTLPQSMPGA
jgi:hypothetical protein